jgi:uncharacterized protein YxeA
MRLATDAPLVEEYFLRSKLKKQVIMLLMMMMIIIMIIQLFFFNVRIQQTDGQLQQQHNTQAKITKDNKQDTSEADTDKKKSILN